VSGKLSGSCRAQIWSCASGGKKLAGSPDRDPADRHSRAFGDRGADVDDGVDADFGAPADAGAVEDADACRQEHLVLDGAAEEAGARADQDVVADRDRVTARGANHRVVADDHLAAESDRAPLGHEHRAKTDLAARPDDDLAADHGGRGDPGRGVDVGPPSLVFDEHDSASFRK
jgi:hypothetical protein